MLNANRRDYRKGYEKHYRLYKNLRKENADINSRRLLLIYSVECGLKYKLLVKWYEQNIESILAGEDKRKKDIIKSHSLELLIKELGQKGNFKFPQLRTVHGNFVSSEAYHQVYRYCIGIDENAYEKEKRMEEILNDIASWIEEGM